AERRQAALLALHAEDLPDVLELARIAADQAAEHGVGLAAADHQGGDHHVARAHHRLGGGRGDALALHDLVIELPVVVEARVIVDVGDFDVLADAQAQAEALDATLNHRRAA